MSNNSFSLGINSQYYTQSTEAHALLHYANELWGIRGKHLLEPSVGAGSFVKEAERMGLDVTWTTCELHPESSNFVADITGDFLEVEPFEVDAVVGNPPFSGSVTYDGAKITLAEAFIAHSLKFAPRVAFILPPSVLRRRYLCRLPEGVRVVAWTEPKEADYTLGGSGGGADKTVRTSLVFIEREAGFRYEHDTSPIPGLEWVETAEEATHAFQAWGAVGAARPLDGSWGKPDPYCIELLAKVTDPAIEKLIASGAIQAHGHRFTSAAPYTNQGEINHLMRLVLSL
jgi:hypothetical protein